MSTDGTYTEETEEICPGRFTKAEKNEMLRVAELVHRELNLSQYSRSDFIVTPKEIYFLEVNTHPQLGPGSTLTTAIESVGATMDDVLEQLLVTATCSK